MPQEFQVLRCYSCETFQVHIIKKVNKWECKMCGEKQSVQKVYAKGTGKDCRLYVQKLNKIRIENENANINEHLKKNTSNENRIVLYKSTEIKPKVSKWLEYTTVDIQNNTNNETEDERYTFENATKRKRIRTKLQTSKMKTNDLNYKTDIPKNTNDQRFEHDFNYETKIVNNESMKSTKDKHDYDFNYTTNNKLTKNTKDESYENDLNYELDITNNKVITTEIACDTSLNADQYKNNLLNSKLISDDDTFSISKKTTNYLSINSNKNSGTSNLDIKQPKNSKWTEYLNNTLNGNSCKHDCDNIKHNVNEILKENIFNTSNEDLDSILSF